MPILPLVVLLATLAPELIAQSWTQAPTPTRPTARRSGAMAFDGTANRLILHGGLEPSSGGLLDETWSYNGTAWTQLTPSSSMAGRWGHRMVRDTLRNRLVTFGGRSPGVNTPANDTFFWSGTGWLPIVSPTLPPPRHLYGMAYDQRRDRIVLFGGRGSLSSNNDTWEFDGSVWRRVETAQAPIARQEMVMEYDAARGSSVLFGGLAIATGAILGDTWEYDGAGWQEVKPDNSPSPRYRAAAAYDTRRQRIVLYGGFDGENISTQTFEYSGSAWSPVSAGPGSSFATEMYAAFDSNRNRFVTFGGFGASFGDQTWEFAGVNSAMTGSFGRGCPTSVGVSSLNSTAPQLGQQLDVSVSPLPLQTTFVLFVQGYSVDVWNNGPLPLSLSPFGMTGCSLEVAGIGTYGVVIGAGAGIASFSFLVPNQTSLLNVVYYAQAFVPDAAASNRIGGMSRPLRAVLGN